MGEKYDAIIIGAGIGGLVCGCYLARAGIKVLIVEQHDMPGGYCTSFMRKGYKFDVGVHYLGSLREGGTLFQILNDFNLLDRLKIITSEVTDRIITPDKTIFISRDSAKTKRELVDQFPNEGDNINNFFDFIENRNILTIIYKTKSITFKELLDSFFTNYKLKSVVSMLLGNIGLPPSQCSALVAVITYRDFILDGGYYPEGGMQAFPDLLAQRFKEYGGELLLSTKATRINTKDKKADSIELSNGAIICAKFIVSNADATSTFRELLDAESLERSKVAELKASPSAFVVYLGLNRELSDIPKHFTTWFFSSYDVEQCYSDGFDLLNLQDFQYLICVFPSLIDPGLVPNDKSMVRIFVGAKFEPKQIFDSYKEDLFQKVIRKLDSIIPNVKNSIEVKEVATPNTFTRFTTNKNGAIFGWAAMPSQVDRGVFPYRTSVENLYLTGHWVTSGTGQSGIPAVAFCGKGTASKIIRRTIKGVSRKS